MMRTLSTEASPVVPHVFSTPRVDSLFTRMAILNPADVSKVAELVLLRCGLKVPTMEQMQKNSGTIQEGDQSSSQETAAPVAEKTIFDLKLMSFDATAKIKVIKEIRAISGLGLKEAKELVEGAPKVIQKGMKKEVAEELKAKLEEIGAVIEIA